MRKDILESITEHLMTGIKPNFADIARRGSVAKFKNQIQGL